MSTLSQVEPTRPWLAITTPEVCAIIRQAASKSAPGGDHITWRYLKLAMSKSPKFTTNLAIIFKQLVASRIMPSSLKRAETVIIPKPKKPDYTVPKVWRPIALLSCISKTLMGCISKCMQHDAITYNLIHPNQYGGLMGHSALDAGLLLAQCMAQAKAHGLFTSVLAVDIAQFFPSVQHPILIAVLEHQGFDPNTVGFISSYLQNQSTSYRWGDSSSKTYDFSVGKPQGCKISPVLACLYVAPLLLHLDDPDPESHHLVLLFVDDTAICAQSCSLDSNILWLVQEYTRWRLAFTTFGLLFEDSKTELFHSRPYMTQSRGKRIFNGNLPSCTIRGPTGDPITICPSKRWCYLGSIFDLYLKYSPHVDWWTNKAHSTLRAMKMLSNSVRGLTPSNKRRMYLTVVLPVLTYGFQFWYQPKARRRKLLYNCLQKIQHEAARWITGSFKTSPSSALEQLAGLSPLWVNLDLLYKRSAVCLAMIPDNTGVVLFSLQPLRWTSYPGVSLKLALRRLLPVHVMPPVRGPRACSPPPIDALRASSIPPIEEPSSYHYLNRPGLRIVDIAPERIVKVIPPPKTSPLRIWIENLKLLPDSYLSNNNNIYVVHASRPGNINKRSGAVGFALLEHDAPEFICTTPLDCTNVQELTLAGIVKCCEQLHFHTGKVTIFTRDQAAVVTAFDTSHGVNCHYSCTVDHLTRHWLAMSESNVLYICWLPKEYQLDELGSLPARVKATRSWRPPPATLSAASMLHKARIDFHNDWHAMVGLPKYSGHNRLPVTINRRRIAP